MVPGLSDTLELCRQDLTVPSPIRSPSLSSTTSPRWIRLETHVTLGWKAGIALDHAVLHLDGAAPPTLRNSTMAPSPVRLTTRPL